MPEDSRPLIVDPICEMFVEGDGDDPDAFGLVVKMYGEDGNGVDAMFTSSDHANEMTKLFQQGKEDMEYAEAHGIHALVEKVGASDEDTLFIPPEFIEDNDSDD